MYKKKKYVMIPVIIILLFVLVGSTSIKKERYPFYDYEVINKNINSYLGMLDHNQELNLKATKEVSNCNDYGCYDGDIKYYLINDTSSDYNSYYVLVTLNVKPKQNQDQLTNDYILNSKLEITSNYGEGQNEDPILLNVLSNIGTIKTHSDTSISLNHFLGQKNLKDAHNDISYSMSGLEDLENNVYRGTFSFKDNVVSNTVKTYYAFTYPKASDNFENTVSIKLDFKHVQSKFLFIESTDTKKMEDTYKVQFKQS